MMNKKKFARVGIIGFGGYVPRYRIRVEEIAEARDKDGKQISRGLGVRQKAVEDKDEDTVSLSVEASRRALMRSGIEARRLGAVLVGSESHPYAVKPTGTIVADILGVGREYVTVDLEFACKAGTTGLIMVASMIEAGLIECGLVIGADVAQSRPGDVLEYTAGAGAAGVILGNKKFGWWARLERVGSYNSDTADFWRRAGESFPEHGGRFTGEPGYFEHVIEGTKRFLGREKIASYDQVVLHMPNAKFPKRAGKRLGVEEKQWERGLMVEEIGNPYSASAMLGLVKVLEEGKKGERVLMTSYGSGAGSDSFQIKILKKLTKSYKQEGVDLASQLAKTEQLSYTQYLLMKGWF
jgi:hydroxymethylglutaryl-CoA synthase